MKAFLLDELKGKKVRCEKCEKWLIILDEERTIIKNRLIVIDKAKGIIEIKCGQCGKINYFHSN